MNELVIGVILLFVILSIRSSPRKISVKRELGEMGRSARGEMMRSNGERRIATVLDDLKIRYQYERRIGDMLPDFYLPEYGVVIEYWGLVNEPGPVGERYRTKMEKKRRKYRAMQIPVVSIYPRDLNNLQYLLSRWKIRQMK